MRQSKISRDLLTMILNPKKGKKSFTSLIVCLLLLVGYYFFSETGFFPAPNSSTSTEEISTTSSSANFPDVETCSVDRCVDGDTLIVISQGEKQRVRMIGANTPETVRPNSPVEPFGPEASAYTKKRIADFDNCVVLKTDGDRIDKYGRRLALVYLGQEGTILLNEELIQQGLARAKINYRYSEAMKRRFSEAEAKAQAAKRGLWSQPN